jgi:hypothetical protein
MNTNSIQQSDEQAVVAAMVDIRHLSTAQLAQLGLQQIAYVKPVVANGTACFAIHAADGTPMALADSRDVAVAAIMQHEMVPAQVH